MKDKVSLNLVYILPLLSLSAYAILSLSVWSWPSMDMAAGIKSWFEPGSIINDLYADCFTDFNPRYFFMFVLAPFKHLGFDWYDSIRIVTLLNVALMPVSYFLVLKHFVGKDGEKLLFTAVGIMAIFPHLFNYTTIGWWSSFSYNFHPSSFSITFLLLGSFFYSKDKYWKILGFTLISASVYIHPIFSFYGACFLFILWTLKNYKIGLAIVFISVLNCFVFLKISSASGLNIDDYYNFFTWHFPEHYIPSRYLSIWPYWYIPFIINVFIMLLAAIHSFYTRDELGRLALLFLFSYSAALAIQYLFVELFPYFNFILLSSPIRYTSYGYFMSSILLILKLKSVTKNLNLSNRYKFDYRKINYLVILSMISVFIYLAADNKSPKDLTKPHELDVINWVNSNVKDGSVIISPPTSFLKVSIPLLTGKGTYYGNGVPFDSSCIIENHKRHVNIYGPTNSSYGRQRTSSFYRKLDMKRLETLEPSANYIVTENPDLSPSGIKINSTYYIYKIKHTNAKADLETF